MRYSATVLVLIISTLSGLISALVVSFFSTQSIGTLLTIFLVCSIAIALLSGFILWREIFRHINAINNLLIQDSKAESTLQQGMSVGAVSKKMSFYTSRKNQEIHKLKEKETFRREFIADISHELKTPIFSAQGFVHTLLDGAIKDEMVSRKFLKKAAKSLDVLDILVKDILTISQIESKQISMSYQSFDMVLLCEEVADQLEDNAINRGVKIKFAKKYVDPIFVLGDRNRIGQVMMNLLSNAINYSKEIDGTAEIRLEEVGGIVRISVKDNGRGIPKEDTSRIFERFYRVDKSRSRDHGGTGLGLSITKHILESHDSRIKVESKMDKGSRFHFELKAGIASK